MITLRIRQGRQRVACYHADEPRVVFVYQPWSVDHHHHLSLKREGRWGTTDDITTSFLPPPNTHTVFHCPLGLGELQACPFSDVVFPPLPLSALFL